MKAELIDFMGSDLTVVNAARVSFDKESKEFEDKDESLIRYLARHNHFTPFTHAFVTLRETVPIFVARQRFKHVVGFTYNEVSRRYVDSPPEFFTPDSWRARPDKSIKQGSGGDLVISSVLDTQEHLNGLYKDFIDYVEQYYNNLIKDGVAPEQARMVLPQSMYTSYYVTGSLAAWARAYELRTDVHAQLEIRTLAKQWGEIIEPLFPISWKYLSL